MPTASTVEDDLAAVTNVAEIVRVRARQHGDDPVLAQLGRTDSWTWRQLDEQVDRAARTLRGRGLQQGQTIALDAPNSLEWLAAYLGALRAGLVVVPVNPGLAVGEAATLAQSCAIVLVVDAGDSALHIPGVERVGLEELLDDVPSSAVTNADPTTADVDQRDTTDPESIAVMIATTGTSGTAKAVRLSHRALLAHCRNTVAAGVPGPDAVALLLLPLFHIYALNGIAGVGLYSGSRLVLSAGLPDDLPGAVAEHGVTHLPVTPSVLYRLIEDDDGSLRDRLASVRALTSGGAPLAQALADEVRRRTGLRVEQGYGMTEASPGITTSEGCPDAERPPGFVGHALPGVEIRVGGGDADTEPAELFIRGDNLFSGYQPDTGPGIAEDGWFGTGDIGYRLGDDVHLVDRARELIIVSGFNVYPSEVEDVLRAFDGVSQAAVIAQPDEHTGERVVAFVTGRGIRKKTRQLRDHCTENLARYKLPVEIYVLTRMPMTSAGEVRKAALRDMLDTVEPETE